MKLKAMVIRCPKCGSDIAVDVRDGGNIHFSTFDVDCDCGLTIRGDAIFFLGGHDDWVSEEINKGKEQPCK